MGLGSRIEWSPAIDGSYLIKIQNREPLPHDSDETYTLTVEDITPDILYAKPSASGDASCSDWDNACELQVALSVADPGDEIWVQKGVYIPINGIGYASCQEIRDALPEAASGDYLINAGGHVFQVYCDNMDSTPAEYLTLWSTTENYAQYTAGGPSPGTDVRTNYSRVSLLPDTLQIDISDQEHSSSNGSLNHGTTEVTSMPYGVAMDCLGAGSNQGVARIDLRDTPFVVSDTFMTCGYYPGGSWTFSEGNQVVELSGGGYCGWVQPAAPECLATPYNDTGGAQPILDLGYQGPERRATFQLKSGVALYGGFAGTETSREERDWAHNVTVLSGDLGGDDLSDPNGVTTDTAHIVGENAYHVVTGFLTETTVLDGFTITGGNANGSGPRNKGGGLYIGGATIPPRLTNVTFSGNQADYGGGMCNEWFTSATLTNVTFSGNRAVLEGGGMWTVHTDATLIDVTFSGNHAGDGGGGMSNGYNSSATLINITFSGNQADGGGGIWNGGSATLINGILWGNTDSSGTGQEAQIYSEWSPVSVSYSLVGGGVYTGTGNITGDPLFVRDPDPGSDGAWGTPDDDYGDLRLQRTSLAIDAGDNTAVPSDTLDLDGDGDTDEPLPFDLGGQSRFVDIPSRPDIGVGPAPVVDMGAYETQMNKLFLPLALRND